MQILTAAGFPAIGEAFPRDWETRLKDANPRGFYESTLRRGINFETNPDPKTGFYLHPLETEDHVVKVFMSALPRTEHAFLGRVIITVRDWREYAQSMARLDALQHGDEAVHPEAAFEAAIEWWVAVSAGIRDVLLRRYPCHLTSYASVVQNPAHIRETLQWIGQPCDVDAAVAAVDPSLYRSEAQKAPPQLDPASVEVFDELYHRIHVGKRLNPGFVQRLNRTHQRLLPVAQELFRRASLRRMARRSAATQAAPAGAPG